MRGVSVLKVMVVLPLLGLLLSCSSLFAQSPGTVVKGVGFQQHLGEKIPLDLQFQDDRGDFVRLGDYCRDTPMVLTLIYYRCPKLCNQVLNGLTAALRLVNLQPGKDYQLVAVSINPEETPKLAADKKASYIEFINMDGVRDGWHFLTGKEHNIKLLADAVGYKYKYDEETKLYVHPALVNIITPEGKIGQYFSGIEFSPRDLRLALVESSENKIGTFVDQVVLFCMAYDPETGTYGFVIMRVLRLMGIITLIALLYFIVKMFLQDRRKTQHDAT